ACGPGCSGSCRQKGDRIKCINGSCHCYP
uniref:Potassium channel toxin alpha-KTx 13.2 n=1 Tax=Orthochirus scrobiculosus TaxID=6892 RepID=KA132_ORTSC|nr:RecName: Full=Potassium channel toxin alpha-KTx 13.2; Short=OsK-2; Short=OsK2 [Orthochirus scrobiculosus]